jgi:hypothetical protein
MSTLNATTGILRSTLSLFVGKKLTKYISMHSSLTSATRRARYEIAVVGFVISLCLTSLSACGSTYTLTGPGGFTVLDGSHRSQAQAQALLNTNGYFTIRGYGDTNVSCINLQGTPDFAFRSDLVGVILFFPDGSITLARCELSLDVEPQFNGNYPLRPSPDTGNFGPWQFQGMNLYGTNTSFFYNEWLFWNTLISPNHDLATWGTGFVSVGSSVRSNLAVVYMYTADEAMVYSGAAAGLQGTAVSSALSLRIDFQLGAGDGGVVKLVSSGSSPGSTSSPGQSETCPLTPNNPSPNQVPFQSFGFTNVPGSNWVSCGIYLPCATGFTFTALGTNTFSAVSSFPGGVTNQFQVSAGGSSLGWFSAGQACTFPSGVSQFDVTWSRPTSAAPPLGIPFQLAFASTNADFTVDAISPPGPQVLLAPESSTIPQGGTAFLSAGALSDTPVSYQWLRNGSAVPYATSPLLKITNAQPSMSGQFQAVCSNISGSVTSDVAVVTIVPGTTVRPALNLHVSPTGSIATLVMSVQSNAAYRIQRSLDLVSWSDLTNFITTDTTFTCQDNALPGAFPHFYRAVSP